jgi:hypothetical protein
MDTDQQFLEAMTVIQARLILIRRSAAKIGDLRKRVACLKIADAIEGHARELDRIALEASFRHPTNTSARRVTLRNAPKGAGTIFKFGAEPPFREG